MSHWFDPESAEQYLDVVDSLQSHTSDAYDQLVQKDLSQIERQLQALAENDQELAANVQRQLKEVVGFVGRFRGHAATTLLALEEEVKQIRKSMAQAMKEQSDLDMERLAIEKSKLHLERWKLVVGLVVAFITGLLFPVVLWWIGVGP